MKETDRLFVGSMSCYILAMATFLVPESLGFPRWVGWLCWLAGMIGGVFLAVMEWETKREFKNV